MKKRLTNSNIKNTERKIQDCIALLNVIKDSCKVNNYIHQEIAIEYILNLQFDILEEILNN